MKVNRVGLGYQGVVTDQGVMLTLDRLYETRGELTGELTVTRAPEGHLVMGRFNVTSLAAATSMAKTLKARSNHVDWDPLIEQFRIGVLRQQRQGAPVVRIGRLPRRPEPPYVLRPLIHEGATTILFGAGGTGKSTLAAAIAVSVQTGKPALTGWRVVRSGPVYVLDWESSQDDWNEHVAAVAKGMGIDPPEIAYRRCAGPLDHQLYEHAAFVSENDIALVIVDSVTWALRTQGEGSIDEPIKRLFDALRLIGSSHLLIDHVSKTAAEEEEPGGLRMPKGGMAKHDSARATFELRTAAPPDPDGTMHLALINRKVNRSRREEPTGITVTRRADGGLVLDTELARLADPVTASAVPLWERIRDALRKGEKLTAAEIVGRIGLAGKDPEATVRKTLSRYPDTFGNEPSKRGASHWFLVDVRHVSGHVSPSTGDTVTYPLTGSMSPGMSRSDRHGFDALEPLAPGFDDDGLDGDPELANDDG